MSKESLRAWVSGAIDFTTEDAASLRPLPSFPCADACDTDDSPLPLRGIDIAKIDDLCSVVLEKLANALQLGQLSKENIKEKIAIIKARLGTMNKGLTHEAAVAAQQPRKSVLEMNKVKIEKDESWKTEMAALKWDALPVAPNSAWDLPEAVLTRFFVQFVQTNRPFEEQKLRIVRNVVCTIGPVIGDSQLKSAMISAEVRFHED